MIEREGLKLFATTVAALQHVEEKTRMGVRKSYGVLKTDSGT